jgi:hypothetical protein
MIRTVLVGVVVMLAAAAGWMLLLPPAAVAQPLAFNHAAHAGAACVVCHDGVETTTRARLPSGVVCIKCHARAPTSVAAPEWERLERENAAFWRPVTTLPDHVMFSHRRHVALAALACASCHADIGQRTAPPTRAPVRLVMDSCLACHRREGVSDDCGGCHR